MTNFNHIYSFTDTAALIFKPSLLQIENKRQNMNNTPNQKAHTLDFPGVIIQSHIWWNYLSCYSSVKKALRCLGIEATSTPPTYLLFISVICDQVCKTT